MYFIKASTLYMAKTSVLHYCFGEKSEKKGKITLDNATYPWYIYHREAAGLKAHRPASPTGPFASGFFYFARNICYLRVEHFNHLNEYRAVISVRLRGAYGWLKPAYCFRSGSVFCAP
jgi:hypothetical protein